MSTPDVAASTGTCRMCGAKASTRCSRCKDVYYCCKEHIANDWKRHKRLCVPAEGVQARPITIDAILFPVDEDMPRMVKVPCDVRHDDSDDYLDPSFFIMHHLDVREWFNLEGETFVRSFDFGGGAVTGTTGYNLALRYDDCVSINGSPVNRCVQSLTRGMAPHSWGGNLLVVRCEKPLMYCDRYYNANMREDLPRVVEALMGYGTDTYKHDPDAANKWGGRVPELEY
ncbi:hypothetical protein EVJ58_g5058 [Rhodofomes roseus]|uniref:MYND-type domain-containing protein n=1 Tax=Rhodofomes roseus TaxID=34475 RepID=A0A4Y9YE07_9APHY|nr:hypothetical protein EVJ58_g5058 [Rhodofomes roseus]